MEQQQENEFERKNETAKRMEDLGKIIDDIPQTIFVCLISPLILKELKDSHPEVYYNTRAKLKNMVKGLTEFLPKLSESVKELQ